MVLVFTTRLQPTQAASAAFAVDSQTVRALPIQLVVGHLGHFL